MPNQLAKSKKRVSFTEHNAVLVALETIAAAHKLTLSDLLRNAVRQSIAAEASDPQLARKLAAAAAAHAPKMPELFRSPAKLAKFKHELREYDQLLQELGIEDSATIQARNSLVKEPKNIRLTTFA